MGSRVVLALIVLAALAAIFFLLAGTDLFSGGGSGAGRDDPGVGSGDALTAVEGGVSADDTAADSASKGPVLFGRSRAERAGIGGLFGRVMDFETGKPVAAATLVLAGEGYGKEPVAIKAKTDADGRFAFDEVAAGDGYALNVSDPKARTRVVPAVSVDAQARKDLGVLWMGQAGVLEGVVLDAGGLPLAGADVQVFSGSASMAALVRNMTKLFEVLDQDAKPTARAASERTGRFRVAGLAPGPYTLLMRAPGFRIETRRIVMTDAGAAGGRVSIRLQAGAPIVGVVVDGRDRPIQDARVAVMAKNDLQSVFFGRQFSRTDAEGRFRIDAPPADGDLAVIIAAEGYPTLFSEAKRGMGSQRFVLVGGLEVTLRMLEKGTERPVEGAHLMAMFAKTAAPTQSTVSFASGVTDHRGEAVFMASPGKLQMLFFSHAEYGSGMFNAMMGTMARGGILEGPKDMTIKDAHTSIVLHVKSGITIRGRVTGPGDTPIAGAHVTTLGMFGTGVSAVTDADGQYELRNQSLPVSALLVDAPGYVQAGSPAGGFGIQGKPDANGEITADVVLKAAIAIAGRVVSAKGRPLAGVQVKVEGTSGMLRQFAGGLTETITNAAGRYVIDGVAPSEKLRVMGHSVGLLDSQTAAFPGTQGVASAPDLVMQLGSRVRVKVETPDGHGAAGARVEVSVQAAERVAWDPMSMIRGFADVTTTPSGRAEVKDLPDGAVTLTASMEGYAAGRVTLATKRAEKAEHEVVIRLREAVTLNGTVTDQDGKPVKGAVVQTRSSGARRPSATKGGSPEAPWVPSVSDTADARGRFALEGLPAQPVNLIVTAEGYAPSQRQVDPADGEVSVRLVRQDPGVKNRMAAIDKELMEIYQRYASVKDDAERKALAARMMQLQQEKQKLQEGNAAPTRR